MKTTLRILALLMVAVLAVGVLAACAPNKDPDKAKAALEKNGYTVYKTSGYGENLVSAALGGDADVETAAPDKGQDHHPHSPAAGRLCPPVAREAVGLEQVK